jgi:hypothetical protein
MTSSTRTIVASWGHGIRRGRNAEIENVRVTASLGITNVRPTVVATRGERLALFRVRLSGDDQQPGAFYNEVLRVIGTDADDRIVVAVLFDADDFDAAITELDARYLAGEASAHSETWSAIARVYAAVNRREFAAKTSDWVGIDHRRVAAFAPGEWMAYVRSGWDVYKDFYTYVEAVHRLSSLGAVVTHAAYGTTREGFEAEWRQVVLVTFEGGLVSRGELFDEGDIETALARFDELQPQQPRLGNAASQVHERFWTYFAARDWAALASVVCDNICSDDRRRVVNSGVRNGRDTHIADMQAIAEVVDPKNLTSTVIATRGARLALCHIRSSNRAVGPDEISAEVLSVVEIDAENRIAAHVGFDPVDIEAAFEELDARYLSGEAAPYAHTWSVITRSYSTSNRHELPEITTDSIFVDHRRVVTTEAENLAAYLSSVWDLMPDISVHIEAVHRLSELGAVFTHVAHGTTQEGFQAEWRVIWVGTVERHQINRVEVFDEADLDSALARFAELDRPPLLLENAATRTWARSIDAWNRRDIDAYLALMTTAGRLEDRRKGLGALLDGPSRRKAIHELFAPPESWRMTTETIAIRGSRLSLTRECVCDSDAPGRPIAVELLTVMEVDDHDRIHYTVSFDPDDINAAFAELTARWIASGEVAHPEVIEMHQRFTETFNCHDWDALAEMTASTTFVDHRQLAAEGTDTIGDHMPSMRTMASLVPDLRVEQAEILTHSAVGLVTYTVAKGTSTEGAAIELPLLVLVLFDGDRVTRIEDFEPAQRDVALARFEEIGRG